MAHKLKVQEQEAIRNLNALGWGIRRIARELKISRNTVRSHVRALERDDPGRITEEILKAPVVLSPGSAVQTDPLSTTGKTGRNSLCLVHAEVILQKLEAGLTAQRHSPFTRRDSSFSAACHGRRRRLYLGRWRAIFTSLDKVDLT